MRGRARAASPGHSEAQGHRGGFGERDHRRTWRVSIAALALVHNACPHRNQDLVKAGGLLHRPPPPVPNGEGHARRSRLQCGGGDAHPHFATRSGGQSPGAVVGPEAGWLVALKGRATAGSEGSEPAGAPHAAHHRSGARVPDHHLEKRPRTGSCKRFGALLRVALGGFEPPTS